MRLDDLFEKAVYHGSPHSFASFDTNFIGTGEGNATYGWGLYFAEVRDVADKYSRDIAEAGHYFTETGKELKTNQLIDAIEKTVAAALARGADDPDLKSSDGMVKGSDIAIKDAKSLLLRGLGQGYTGNLRHEASFYAKDYPSVAFFLRAIAGFFSRLKWRAGEGKVYHVEISDTTNFLDWQEVEQPPAIQALIPAGMTGFEYYRKLTADLGSQKAASVSLLRQGVDGIRYRDRGSRQSDAPTYNYVVFNHSLVTITKVD